MNRKTLIANAAPAQGRCAFMRVAGAFGGRCGDGLNAMRLALSGSLQRAGENDGEMPPGEGSA